MRSFSRLGGELVTVGQGSEGLPGNQPYCLLRAVGDGGCLSPVESQLWGGVLAVVGADCGVWLCG